MTSGHFHSVEIDAIQIERDGRQRREITALDELADSVSRIGLINPICISRDNVLVAGERRLEACRSLGWTHIPCHYTDELDPAALRTIELEENVKRQALPWKDECLAVREFHQLRKGEDSEWNQNATAKALGLSPPAIAQRLGIAEEILSGNARVLAAPKMSTARGIVERAQSRKAIEAVAAIRGTTAQSAIEPDDESIINEDFLSWAPTYDGPKFNFIHCDFPYGIGADKFNQGSAATHGGYDDSEDTYWRLCGSLVDNLDRLAAESCHIMFWFSMRFYQPTLDFFAANSDFRLDPFPLIWTKSDNIGILPDPSRGPRRIYETCLFGSRGDRKVVAPVSNSFPHPSVRDVHMSVKPEPMLTHFFRMFVDDTTFLLDPTCGSGGALRAAERLGASYVLGLERNPEFATAARVALAQSRKPNAKAV